MKSRFWPSGQNEIGGIPRSLATGIVNSKGFIYWVSDSFVLFVSFVVKQSCASAKALPLHSFSLPTRNDEEPFFLFLAQGFKLFSFPGFLVSLEQNRK